MPERTLDAAQHKDLDHPTDEGGTDEDAQRQEPIDYRGTVNIQKTANVDDESKDQVHRQTPFLQILPYLNRHYQQRMDGAACPCAKSQQPRQMCYAVNKR